MGMERQEGRLWRLLMRGIDPLPEGLMALAQGIGSKGKKNGKHNRIVENQPDPPRYAHPVGCDRILSKTQGATPCTR